MQVAVSVFAVAITSPCAASVTIRVHGCAHILADLHKVTVERLQRERISEAWHCCTRQYELRATARDAPQCIVQRSKVCALAARARLHETGPNKIFILHSAVNQHWTPTERMFHVPSSRAWNSLLCDQLDLRSDIAP